MKRHRNIYGAILQFRGGSLQIFGDWLGRPHDNWHKPESVDVEESLLTITFNEGEHLIIENPGGVTATEKKIVVKHANRVRWEWFYYGRPKLPESLFYLEYERRGGKEVIGTTNVDWYQPPFNVSASAPAVRIH